MKVIITHNTLKKRYHLHEIDNISDRIVKVCRYCTITGEFFSVKIKEKEWESFYKSKIVSNALKNVLTKEEYIFLSKNLTKAEFKKEQSNLNKKR